MIEYFIHWALDSVQRLIFFPINTNWSIKLRRSSNCQKVIKHLHQFPWNIGHTRVFKILDVFTFGRALMIKDRDSKTSEIAIKLKQCQLL